MSNDTIALKRLAKRGNLEAQLILDFLSACEGLPEQIGGLAPAIGISSDTDEILNGVLKNFTATLLPLILTYAGGYEQLISQVPAMDLFRAAVFNCRRFNQGRYPKEVLLHPLQKPTMQEALGIYVDDHKIGIRYTMRRANGERLGRYGYDYVPEDEQP